MTLFDLYQNTILKQAHTNTIYNIREENYIVRFKMFGRIFMSKLLDLPLIKKEQL